ncbi:MAG TPA: kelch repeat-containing protein [Candidatus Angelobacter sp.]
MQSSGFATGNWSRLTPDNTGSYVNGTWSLLATMPSVYAPLFYASAVLPDGRVVVEGGEHNGNQRGAETSLGAIYNPVTNSWTSISPPSGITEIGDAQSVVLSNGTFMVGLCCFQTAQYLLNASTLTWTATGSGKADSNTEEGWTLLPNGKVLAVDTQNGTNSELYNPSTGSWSSAGSTIVALSDGSPNLEIGPAVLRPGGTVFATGGTSDTAIYNPTTGGWSAGPTFPSGLDVADGPAALLPSGNVLIDSSPGVFQNGTHFFEFNGTSLISVPAPANAASRTSFQGRMLVLPTGQILFTDQSSTVQIYTPGGAFQNAWRPTITAVATALKPSSTNNAISGTQFNGLSQGGMYGDDAQMATNYPLVRITNNASGHVFYAKTHGHSTMAVATGTATVSTQFDVPGNTESGASTLQVVANGIPSNSVAVTITGSSQATGALGITGNVTCTSTDTGPNCDFGTFQVTINNTTETVSYNGLGFYGLSADPGTPQAIAQAIVDAFNNDPNSPVTATLGGNGVWLAQFTTKQGGSGVNFGTNLVVTSIYDQENNSNPLAQGLTWSWTPSNAASFTWASPISGSLSGGH